MEFLEEFFCSWTDKTLLYFNKYLLVYFTWI